MRQAPRSELLADPAYTYAYDADGRRTSRTSKSTGEVTTYAWDARGRLTGAAVHAADGTLLKAVAFTYDALNQRIRTVVTDGTGAVVSDERYVNTPHGGASPDAPAAGMGSQAALDDLSLVLDASGAVVDRVLYGPGVDEVVAEEDGSGAVSWLVSDPQRTVRAVLHFDAATSVTSVAKAVGYDAFGNVVSDTAPEVAERFGYDGRTADGVSGLQYGRAREYDAGTGTWATPDPDGFGAGDTNEYRYVGNSPTNAVDPSGRWIIVREADVAKWVEALKERGVDVEAVRIDNSTYVFSSPRYVLVPKNTGGLAAWNPSDPWGQAVSKALRDRAGNTMLIGGADLSVSPWDVTRNEAQFLLALNQRSSVPGLAPGQRALAESPGFAQRFPTPEERGRALLDMANAVARPGEAVPEGAYMAKMYETNVVRQNGWFYYPATAAFGTVHNIFTPGGSDLEIGLALVNDPTLTAEERARVNEMLVRGGQTLWGQTAAPLLAEAVVRVPAPNLSGLLRRSGGIARDVAPAPFEFCPNWRGGAEFIDEPGNIPGNRLGAPPPASVKATVQPGAIGLGLDENLLGLTRMKASTYDKWYEMGLTRVPLEQANASAYKFQRAFTDATARAPQIIFDLSDLDVTKALVDGPKGFIRHNYTNAELSYIVTHNDILAKTTFIQNGRVVKSVVVDDKVVGFTQ